MYTYLLLLTCDFFGIPVIHSIDFQKKYSKHMVLEMHVDGVSVSTKNRDGISLEHVISDLLRYYFYLFTIHLFMQDFLFVSDSMLFNAHLAPNKL